MEYVENASNIKLIIFDKDVTLINHEKMFKYWTIRLVNSMESLIDNKTDLFNYLGSSIENRIKHDNLFMNNLKKINDKDNFDINKYFSLIPKERINYFKLINKK